MSDQPKDNRPDVEVRSKARKNSNEAEWYLEIQHEAVCRFGCGSFHSPDVNQICIWVTEHTCSRGHRLAKAERLGLAVSKVETVAEARLRRDIESGN